MSAVAIRIDPQPSAPRLQPVRRRVLVVHDWLVTWAGSERVVEALLDVYPDADLVVGVMAESMRGFNGVADRARETWLSRLPGARTHHRWFLPLQAAAFRSLDTSDYDVVVSSSHAFSKTVRPRGRAVHVSYCHSPPRYLWDLADTYRASATALQRGALWAGTTAMRRLDRWSASGVDQFLGNSGYVAERIRRCYGRPAQVVYPPVKAKPGTPAAERREPFMLHLGRLVPYKRVDLAVTAAERLGVRLVVAGDGPERERLERLAGPNTSFVGEVSEREASELLSTCAAFVFCAEEDFGIAPVEANAHGAPVVGFGRGGLLETMVPGVTGELFDEPTTDAVADAMRRVLDRSWSVSALKANAHRFRPERFREDVAAAVDAAVRAADRNN
jgi:glycosyltransferase involved in cell wall biosynthesis